MLCRLSCLAPYLCRMKANPLIISLFALAAYSLPTHAQFNTITDGRHRYKVSVVVEQAKVPIDTMPTISAAELSPKAKSTRNVMSNMAYPLKRISITSPYGMRVHPITKKKAKHNGLDLKAYYEPAYAMLYGEVVNVGTDNKSGNYITLQHGNIIISYCHLSYVALSKGATVYPGDIVGITGNTGCSIGPHLHLTCKMKGEAFDPTLLFNFQKLL